MKKIVALFSFSFVLFSGCAQREAAVDTALAEARQAGWSHYGFLDTFGPEELETPLAELEGSESGVIVSGTIREVCAKKGCWMTLEAGGAEVMVRFEDYAFFVPRNAAGRRVVLHGRTEVAVASVEELRHYAEDKGADEATIAAITEPERRITFYADAAFIEGDGLEEPYTP